MVQISHGIQDLELQVLADRHWSIINPRNSKSLVYYKDQSLISRITQIRDHYLIAANVDRRNFYNAFLANDYTLLRRIVTHMIQDTPGVINDINTLLLQCNLHPLATGPGSFGAEILKVFAYDNWRSNGKGGELFDLLGIQVCPYCNMELVSHDEKHGKVLAEFDHYYDKATYPYLSLSFSNIIPVCDNCNSGYKLSNSFSIATQLHPYLDNYNTNVILSSDFINVHHPYRILFAYNPNPNARAASFTDLLGFDHKYNLDNARIHAKLAYEASQRYPLAQKQLIMGTIGVELEECESYICDELNTPFYCSEILNKQYGKLKRDLAKQYSIITSID